MPDGILAVGALPASNSHGWRPSQERFSGRLRDIRSDDRGDSSWSRPSSHGLLRNWSARRSGQIGTKSPLLPSLLRPIP